MLDAFYGFKKLWFFRWSLPHSLQFEKCRLTWDGKCEKFSFLFSLTQAQKGYSGFQVTGMIEWGQKSRPPKHPSTKMYPPKNPMPNFRAMKKFPESIKWNNTKNGNISFEYPKKSLLKSSYQKKYCPKSRNRKFPPPQNPSINHIPVTWNPQYPPRDLKLQKVLKSIS